MKILVTNWKSILFVLVTFLITFGMQGVSYAQVEIPTITASTPEPLTNVTLDGSLVKLTLSGGVYEKFRWDIADAITVSGIPDVTIGQNKVAWFGVDRLSDTEITVELGFDGEIDTDATLTFTVGAGAIANYNGPALTAEVPVTVQPEEISQPEEVSRFCQVGDVIAPGESCTYVTDGKNIVFSVKENGAACREGGPITRVVLGLNVVVQNLEFCVDYDIEQDETFNSNFAARKNSDSSWTIDTVPAETPANVPAVVTEDVDDGSIDTEETTEIAPKPITPTEAPSPVISFSPSPVTSPYLGGQLTVSLNITGAENVTGYSIIIQYDNTVLQYVDSVNSDFLPTDSFFSSSQLAANQISLTATALAKQSSNGDGTLATLTFEVIDLKPSTLTFTDVLLSDPEGVTSIPEYEDVQIVAPQSIKGDVNRDGLVNISDLVLVASLIGQTGDLEADVNGDGMVNISDLVIVAGEITGSISAPSLWSQNNRVVLTRTQVEQWLHQAQQLNAIDAASQRGVRFLEQLLAALTPKETALFPNFPNPFNPETWIPYQLSKDTEVTLTIYDIKGHVVRSLDLGHQRAGLYQTRSRAAYWDGRNAVGEPVASGVYFYTLKAGDFTATRKMLIRK